MRRAVLFACLGLCLAATGQGQEAEPRPAPERPKLGLVLSGGGARGAAHVGVLKVLHELRIPIDCIAGNSIGALVGGNFAYGYSPDELEAVLLSIDWSLVLSDGSRREDLSIRRKSDDVSFLIDYEIGLDGVSPVFPRGIAQGNRALNILKFLTPDWDELKSFDELAIPFRAVATDIASGEQVLLKEGDLPRSLLASMSIPGVFAPVSLGGRDLIDGMLVNNLPIDVARGMGAELLIVVDVGTPILKAEEIDSLFSVTAQMLNLLMQTSIDAQYRSIQGENQHTIVRPNLGKLASGDFTRIAEAIERGEQAAWAVQSELERYRVSELEYARFLARQRRRPPTPRVVERIELDNRSRLGDGVILSKLSTRVGEPLDPERLKADLDAIIGTKEFELVTFDFPQQADGSQLLRIRVDEKSWGPNYLRFGLNLEDNFNGNSDYNLGLNYTIRPLNRLGAEWRTQAQIGNLVGLESEFYQPLEDSGSFFIAPAVSYQDSTQLARSGNLLLADLDVSYAQAGLRLGYNLSNWASLSLGLFLGRAQVDIRSSALPISDFSIEDAFLRAQLTVDTLDEVYFPTQGRLGSVRFDVGREDWGSDEDYQDLNAFGLQAIHKGSTSLLLLGELGATLDGTLPLHRNKSVGGFLRLSGTERGFLTGRHSLRSALVAYRLVAGERGVLFGFPTYLGGSVEFAHASEEREELLRDGLLGGSVFLGVDMPFAPLYLGYGLAEGGESSLYLYLGQTF